MEILKVQVPVNIDSELKDGPALVYNFDKSFIENVPVTEDLLAAMKGRHKAYFEAEIVDGVGFKLVKEAEWQVW